MAFPLPFIGLCEGKTPCCSALSGAFVTSGAGISISIGVGTGTGGETPTKVSWATTPSLPAACKRCPSHLRPQKKGATKIRDPLSSRNMETSNVSKDGSAEEGAHVAESAPPSHGGCRRVDTDDVDVPQGPPLRAGASATLTASAPRPSSDAVGNVRIGPSSIDHSGHISSHNTAYPELHIKHEQSSGTFDPAGNRLPDSSRDASMLHMVATLKGQNHDNSCNAARTKGRRSDKQRKASGSKAEAAAQVDAEGTNPMQQRPGAVSISGRQPNTHDRNDEEFPSAAGNAEAQTSVDDNVNSLNVIEATMVPESLAETQSSDIEALEEELRHYRNQQTVFATVLAKDLALEPVSDGAEPEADPESEPASKQKSRYLWPLLCVAIVIIIVAAVVVPFFVTSGGSDNSGSNNNNNNSNNNNNNNEEEGSIDMPTLSPASQPMAGSTEAPAPTPTAGPTNAQGKHMPTVEPSPDFSSAPLSFPPAFTSPHGDWTFHQSAESAFIGSIGLSARAESMMLCQQLCDTSDYTAMAYDEDLYVYESTQVDSNCHCFTNVECLVEYNGFIDYHERSSTVMYTREEHSICVGIQFCDVYPDSFMCYVDAGYEASEFTIEGESLRWINSASATWESECIHFCASPEVDVIDFETYQGGLQGDNCNCYGSLDCFLPWGDRADAGFITFRSFFTKLNSTFGTCDSEFCDLYPQEDICAI